MSVKQRWLLLIRWFWGHDRQQQELGTATDEIDRPSSLVGRTGCEHTSFFPLLSPPFFSSSPSWSLLALEHKTWIQKKVKFRNKKGRILIRLKSKAKDSKFELLKSINWRCLSIKFQLINKWIDWFKKSHIFFTHFHRHWLFQVEVVCADISNSIAVEQRIPLACHACRVYNASVTCRRRTYGTWRKWTAIKGSVKS